MKNQRRHAAVYVNRNRVTHQPEDECLQMFTTPTYTFFSFIFMYNQSGDGVVRYKIGGIATRERVSFMPARKHRVAAMQKTVYFAPERCKCDEMDALSPICLHVFRLPNNNYYIFTLGGCISKSQRKLILNLELRCCARRTNLNGF